MAFGLPPTTAAPSGRGLAAVWRWFYRSTSTTSTVPATSTSTVGVAPTTTGRFGSTSAAGEHALEATLVVEEGHGRTFLGISDVLLVVLLVLVGAFVFGIGELRHWMRTR
jgi:hypothetical protein